MCAIATTYPMAYLSHPQKNMYVFEQKEVMRQNLSDMTPFALIPYSYTSGRGEGFVVKLERRLPFRRDLGGGCHVRPGLGYWLSNNDSLWWPWRSPRRRISRASLSLLNHTLSFLRTARGRRRRGSWISALGFLLLRGWPGSRHKTADRHRPSCHHIVTLIWFDNCFLSCLNGGFGFNESLGFGRGFRLDGYVYSTV